jgi:hypothetical protein
MQQTISFIFAGKSKSIVHLVLGCSEGWDRNWNEPGNFQLIGAASNEL